MITSVNVNGIVDVEPTELIKYIKGEKNNLGYKPYADRFAEEHCFIADLFCEMGYGQNSNGEKRTGYLQLYDFLKEYNENSKNTNYKKDVDRLINNLSYQVVTEFGREIEDTNNRCYPSQKWHYLISYAGWKQLEQKSLGRCFKCAELLLFLYEIIDGVEEIETILNTYITSVDLRQVFIKKNNDLENKSFTLFLDEKTLKIKVL